NGTFVAVGDGKLDDSIILTSTNGATWNSANSGTGKNLRGVAYGNGMFVAVGNDGTILNSLDGADWTADVLRIQNRPVIADGHKHAVAISDAAQILAR